MKYIATIDTDEFKDFEFFEDADGKYLVARDAGAKSDEWIVLRFTEAEMQRQSLNYADEDTLMSAT